MKKVASYIKAGLACVALCACVGLFVAYTETSYGSTPPNPPSEDMPEGVGEAGSTPPEKPEGEAPGEPPSSGMVAGEGSPGGPGGPGGMGGADTMNFDFAGTYSGALAANGESITSEGETISATETDQNVALVQNGGTLLLGGATLEKAGDDTNGDNCNFYGLNSVVLTVGNGSKAVVTDSVIAASSVGSNGLFATDSGTIYANEVNISTDEDNSRGLDATYAGTIVANAIEVSTQGEHCAAVATDRGGGYISVANSTLATKGSGSPLLYSTGDIEVSNVTGKATGSQIAGMEGLNSILIQNSSLESTVTGKTASDPVANGIIIYQSTSGDAEAKTGETATFTALNSTLKSAITSGSMFYFTNTKATVVLQNTTLDFDSSKATLIQATGNNANNWGSDGSNGAQVNFTAIGQTLEGIVEVDTISSVDLYLTKSSYWTGAAHIVENANATSSEAPLNVNVGDGCVWLLTENSTVSNLNVEGTGCVLDETGALATIVDTEGNVLSPGESSLKVTVTGSYNGNAAIEGAAVANEASIDRAEFDSTFSTNTAFANILDIKDEASSTASSVVSSESAQASSSSSMQGNQDERETSSDEDANEGFFQWLWRTISSLFG